MPVASDADLPARIILDDHLLLEFSSASTEVIGWQEVGSLNIQLVSVSSEDQGELMEFAIPKFALSAVDKVMYEDEDAVSECGLVLCGDGDEIVIAAGIPPGSVSVSAPFSEGPFEPQFSLSMCRRERL